MSNRRLLLRGITRSHRSFVTSFEEQQQQQQQQLLQQLQQQHPLQQFTEEPRVNQLGIQYLSNDLHKRFSPPHQLGLSITTTSTIIRNI